MKPLADMQPDEILREYFAERRRRESPPSLAGVDPEAPKEKGPPSGRWEELISMTRGCDPGTLLIMYEASSSYTLKAWRCPEKDCWQSVEHKHTDVLGSDGHPVMVGGKALNIAVTTPVDSAAVARKHGLEPKAYKAMTAAVLAQVAENLGRKRAEVETHSDDGPTLADVQALAREVMG